MTICVVEEASALDEIDAIAATPGVDAIFIGTSDLSFSLGLRGKQNEPALDRRHRADCGSGAAARQVLGRPAGTPELVRRLHGTGLPAVSNADRNRTDGVWARQLLEPLGSRNTGRPAFPLLEMPRDQSTRVFSSFFPCGGTLPPT